MPIYEYRCENGHTFDAFQSMSDDPITECRDCGAPCQRVLSPVAIHFKGSGFYTTDYKRKGSKAAGASKDSDSGSSSSSSDSSSSDSSSSSSSSSDSKGSGDATKSSSSGD